MRPPAALLVALLGLLVACAPDPPTQHDPVRYGAATVFVSPEWGATDSAAIRAELGHLGNLGPTFTETDARPTARVIVQPFATDSCWTNAAHWTVGTRVVEIDRTCMTDEDSFEQAVGHEIGHALGLTHICERPGDLPRCSPVGYGLAMMGPHLRGADNGPGFGEAYTGAAVNPFPTDLDLAEYRRTHPTGGDP